MTRPSLLEKFEEISPDEKYTAKDYFNLPEGSPYQLIEGELIMSPSPLTEHQIISKNLDILIFNHVKKNNLGLALNAPIDVYLDNENAYQPDIIFISNNNKDIIKKRGIDGAPDMVIEILSPSNGHYDVKIKKNIYEKNGVLEYIIIDPQSKTADAYRQTTSQRKFDEYESFDLNAEGKLLIKTLNLYIDLKEIFTEI